MSTFYLIRHASNDLVGHSIAGRKPGVHLNERGQEEAQRLARALQGSGIARVFSSPLERVLETAQPLAQALGVAVETLEAIKEIDFAGWTGRAFADLKQDPAWQQWNSFRTAARVPNGETILEVQARMVGAVRQLWEKFPNDKIAIVGHGDPLRTIIFYFLGISLDFVSRIEISPASYTILKLESWGPQIAALNVTV